MKEFAIWLAGGLMLLLCLCCPCSAEQKNQTVRAGIFAFDGYHEIDRDGQLGGYGIDFLNLLSRYSHLNFELAGLDKSWKEMQKMLKNGEIDLVTSARRTPEREENFAFSLPIGKNATILSTRIDNTDYHVGDYRHWDGIRIGILRGSTQNATLETYARNRGFNYVPVEFDDAHDLAEALKSGKVDAILTSNLRKAEGEKSLEVIDSNNFYAIVRKEDRKLIEEINYAIEQMDQNEGDWRNILFYRNYGPGSPAGRSFTEREKEFMEAARSGARTVTVAAAESRPPYSYREGDKIKGIIPDYFQMIMDEVGIPFKYITSDEGATGEKADIVIDSTSPERTRLGKRNHGFDTPVYLRTGIARVSKVDYHGTVKTIALTQAYLTPELRRHLPKQVKYLFYPTQNEAMEAVAAGRADAAYVDGYAAQNFVNQDPSKGLIYSMLNGAEVGFRMHVPNYADHELITILNKSMSLVPEGAINQLIHKYTAPIAGNMTLLQYLQRNPMTIVYGVLIAIFLACIIFGLYWNSKLNRKLLLETEKSNRKLGEQLAIVEALSRDYTNVFAVNEKTGEMRPIKLEDSLAMEMLPERKQYAYDKFLDCYLNKCVHPEDRSEFLTDLSLERIKSKLNEGSDYIGTYRLMDAGGMVHYYQFIFIKFMTSHENFILAGLRNIDEMIRHEQEQKEILSDALVKANSANVAKTNFLNNMSHDIRTPMNAIMGFTHLASTHLDNTSLVRSYLGKITTSGNHLISLINDVLDMSRIESGKVKLDETEVNLRDLISDIRTIVDPDIKAKGLRFDVCALDIRNENIVCDKLRMRQVLINILSNAIKYTLAGGEVRFCVTQLPDLSPDHARFEFRVGDTGIGMSEAFLDHVFEPFEREQTSTVSGIQGTGLGLAITKNIVNMMGGTISVESEKGKGSEFFVNLEFRIGSATSAVEDTAFSGLRCLVLGNEGSACSGLVDLLTSLGTTCECLEGPALSSGALQAGQPHDVYFVDWQGPEQGLIEAVRQLRAIIGETAAVIVVSSSDWTGIEEEARSAGVSDFCSRPVFRSDLARLLKSQEANSSQSATNELPAFEGKRVLLVDDNEINLEIGQMILENLGLEVDTAEDGSEAVEKVIAAAADKWDLILMDVQMPILDGYAATRQIRALSDPVKAGITIVAMTANAFEEDRKEAMAAGMDGYVSKPIDLKQLTETLRKALSGGRPERN